MLLCASQQHPAYFFHVRFVGNRHFYRKLCNIVIVAPVDDTFFNEFVISLPSNASEVVDNLVEKKIFAGVPVSRLHHGKFENLLLVACTETVTDEQIELFSNSLKF